MGPHYVDFTFAFDTTLIQFEMNKIWPKYVAQTSLLPSLNRQLRTPPGKGKDFFTHCVIILPKFKLSMRGFVYMQPFISLTKSFKLLIVGRKLKKDLMVDIISEGLGNSIFTPIKLIQIRFL